MRTSTETLNSTIQKPHLGKGNPRQRQSYLMFENAMSLQFGKVENCSWIQIQNRIGPKI